MMMSDWIIILAFCIIYDDGVFLYCGKTFCMVLARVVMFKLGW